MATFQYDIVIVGASFGGVAAALAAASDPKVRVVLLEAGTWVGGQATSQGVTRWDEAAADLTETTGSPKSYRDLRNAIRAWYRAHATLSSSGSGAEYFNPGFSEPGHPFSADPQVTREVLDGMLAALHARLDVKFGVSVTAVDAHEGSVHSITVTSGTATDTYIGKVYLDATDLGDLLPLCEGLPWVIGAEAKGNTGESRAPDVAHPEWIQPITVPIALELRPEGENHTISQPLGYDDIVKNQDFRVDDGDITTVFGGGGGDTLWNYRQYVNAANFDDDRYRCSRTTLNVGSNDYQAKAIPTGSRTQDAQIVEEARAVSIAFAYWLQHDCPHDGDPTVKGYPNVMLRPDAFGRNDGTAPAAYIRESRRIDAEVRVVQGDIDAEAFPEGTPRAQRFEDACAIGSYGVDVHAAIRGATHIGTPWIGFGTLPFQVPLGALLPKDLDNLVAACKNIGTTHLTSGAYRVHPVEWAIGEAAGMLAAYSVTQGVTPKDAWTDAGRVTALQRRLLARGAPIFWWADVRFEDDAQAFAAIHLLAVRRIFEGDGTLDFHPGDPITQAERDGIDAKENVGFPWPDGPMTRAEAAVWLCGQLGLPL